MQYRTLFRIAVLGVSGLAVMGCQSIRSAAGLTKEGPDEFAVVTKQPLIIPPEYNLRPPRDGAPPTNQVAPTDSAQAALFDSDPATAAKLITGDYSDGEKMLLAKAGAINPDPSIRQQIASDGRAMEAVDDGFAKKVLFWQDEKIPGDPVNAEAEDKRIAAQKAAGEKGDTKPKDSAVIQGKEENKDSGHGWLDGIF